MLALTGCVAGNLNAIDVYRLSTSELVDEDVVVTLRNTEPDNRLPFTFEIPEQFNEFGFVTLIVSKTRQTGGWSINTHLDGDTLTYCLMGPKAGSPVTMALESPAILIGHNNQFRIDGLGLCSIH